MIDWPHDFAPSNPSDYDKIELAKFVTGFLAMIKPHDNLRKSAMLEYLELQMTKALSYSWPSVRTFHAQIAKQIELCHLEWTSFTDIRDKAVTFFKHSDLHSSQPRTNPGMISSTPLVTPPYSPSPTKSEAEKACRRWNIMVLVPVTSQIWNLLTPITNAAFVQKSIQCCIVLKGKILFRLQILLDDRMMTSCTWLSLQF